MATLAIPRFSTNTRIGTDAQGKPVYASADFITAWNMRVAQPLEQAQANTAATIAKLQDTVTMLQAAQAQINTVSMVANNASSTATSANTTANPGSPQRQTASATHVVNSPSWLTVVSINFASASAASAVDLDGSGITGGSSLYTGHGPGLHYGQVQMLRNGSVIAGPTAYSLDQDGALTFAGFSAPGGDATTGSVTYDLQVKKTGGINANASFLDDVTRTP